MPYSNTTVAAAVGVVLLGAYLIDASRLPVVGGLFKKKTQKRDAITPSPRIRSMLPSQFHFISVSPPHMNKDPQLPAT